MMATDTQYIVRALTAAADPSSWNVELAREVHERSASWLTPPDQRPQVARVDEVSANGVKAKVYRPGTDGKLRPTLLWVHGGGWMTGSLDTADIIARTFSFELDAVVVTPHYRLAPEHTWPAGLNDVRATLDWVAENIDDLGGDAGRLVVGGDSAGGNLAAIIAQESRFREPRPAAQVLIYPVVDLSLTTSEYPSRSTFAKGFHLELENIIQCVTTYLPEDADVADPTISPVRLESLAGLPAAVIATADLDPLRDEGRFYAERLQDAGVPVRYLNTPGMVHGGFDMLGVSSTARAAMASLTEAVADIL